MGISSSYHVRVRKLFSISRMRIVVSCVISLFICLACNGEGNASSFNQNDLSLDTLKWENIPSENIFKLSQLLPIKNQSKELLDKVLLLEVDLEPRDYTFSYHQLCEFKNLLGIRLTTRYSYEQLWSSNLFDFSLLSNFRFFRAEGVIDQRVFDRVLKAKNIKEIIAKSVLDSIPPYIKDCTKLEVLKIYCHVKAPIEMAALPLKDMICSFSNTEMYFQLRFLESLDLSSIDSIPSEIGNLTKLKVLSIDNSRINNIPQSIGKCRDLVELRIERCPNLKKLPDSLMFCKNMKLLIIKDVPLVSFPNVRNISTLTKIEIEKTKIKSVPDFIGSLSGIKELTINESSVLDVSDWTYYI